MKRFFGSSVNPEKLSLTIKAILGAVVIVLGFWGYGQIINVDELTKAIVDVVQNISLTITAIVGLWGLIRKLLVAIGIIK